MDLEEELGQERALGRVLAQALELGQEQGLARELALPSSWGSSSRKVHC